MSCAQCESNWHHARSCPLVRAGCDCNDEHEACEYHAGYIDALSMVETRAAARSQQRHTSRRD